jgi:uncharacterized protein (TIRG00374 family)
MRKGVRKALIKIAKALFGGALIAYVIYSGRLDFPKIAEADWRRVLAAWGMLLAVPVLGWLRWHAILRMQDIRIGLSATLRIQLIGVLFNLFLLGGTGGDAIRAYYVAVGEGRSKKAAAVATILIDRVFGVTGVIVVMGLGLLVSRGALLREPTVAVTMATLVGICGAVFCAVLVLMIPRFRGRRHKYLRARAAEGRGIWSSLAATVDRMDGALQEIVRHPRWAALCILLSVLGWTTLTASFLMFFRALGVAGVPISTFSVLVPLSLVANGLPIAPAGGLGLGELVASELFKAGVDVGKALGGTAMFMWRIGMHLTAPVGVVFFVLQRDEVRRAFAAARSAREDTGGAEDAEGVAPEADAQTAG